MKPLPHIIRGLAALSLIFLAAGCTPTLTREPFGEFSPVPPKEERHLAGTWASPDSGKKEHTTLAFVPTASGKPETRRWTVTLRGDGKEQVYDIDLRKVDTGVRNSPETIAFFRPAGTDRPWRFA